MLQLYENIHRYGLLDRGLFTYYTHFIHGILQEQHILVFKSLSDGWIFSSWVIIEKLHYTQDFLRNIQKESRDPCNYPSFNLNQLTRSWIISLGIKKQPRHTPYRHSMRGRNLFNMIYNIISKHCKWQKVPSHGSKPKQLNTLQAITFTQIQKSAFSTCKCQIHSKQNSAVPGVYTR